MISKKQRAFYLLLPLLLAALAIGIIILPKVLQAQTASTFLRPPYYGKELVNCVFDHE